MLRLVKVCLCNHGTKVFFLFKSNLSMGGKSTLLRSCGIAIILA